MRAGALSILFPTTLPGPRITHRHIKPVFWFSGSGRNWIWLQPVHWLWKQNLCSKYSSHHISRWEQNKVTEATGKYNFCRSNSSLSSAQGGACWLLHHQEAWRKGGATNATPVCSSKFSSKASFRNPQRKAVVCESTQHCQYLTRWIERNRRNKNSQTYTAAGSLS